MTTPTPKPTYSLVGNHRGSSFYDKFYFFTARDPTHGDVDYIGRDEAKSLGLVGMRDGKVYMGYATSRIYPSTSSTSTSTTPTTTATDTSGTATSTTSAATTTTAIPDFKAVRISTYESFTGGIFVLDAEHLPTGCGLWPSFWTVPANPVGGWPNGGEIDIVEGVHDTGVNTYSVHTIRGCSVNASTTEMSGRWAMSNAALATNCASADTSNQGCGVRSSLSGDYGVSYNSGGGGVHVMLWDEAAGIKAWFFKRASVPADLLADKPDPTGWGTPAANWPATDCDPLKFFFNHVVVFTNTICGDWAGAPSVWNYPQSAYGQTKSCKEQTGYPTCSAYMQANPDLSQAYWLINYVKIYQTARKY